MAIPNTSSITKELQLYKAATTAEIKKYQNEATYAKRAVRAADIRVAQYKERVAYYKKYMEQYRKDLVEARRELRNNI